jgi:hypothetical protein
MLLRSSRSASRALFVTVALIAMAPSKLVAKDLGLLTRLLIPGFMAQDFASLCDAYDPGFLPEVKNGSAGVSAYAQHLKIEITVNLTQADAMNVMRAAADAARAVARKESRQVLQNGRTGTGDPLKGWCERSVKPFILTIIKLHAEKHGEFDKMVEAAKH